MSGVCREGEGGGRVCGASERAKWLGRESVSAKPQRVGVGEAMGIRGEEGRE